MNNLRSHDNYFNPEIVYAAEAEWPDASWPYWYRYDNGKLATHDESRIPPACRYLLSKMIETGIKSSFYDPHDQTTQYFADWSFYGAGLHCMPNGSRLGTHLDSEVHPNQKWLRAFSMVLHLNPVWDPSWGGRFYFKTSLDDANKITFDASFNKLITFKCTDTSYHGVEQLTCPPDITRKTLAVFFWRKFPANTEIVNPRTKAHFFD